MNRILKIIDIENGKIKNVKEEELKKNDGNQTKFQYIDNFLNHWTYDNIGDDKDFMIYWGNFEVISAYSDGTFSAKSIQEKMIREGYSIEEFDIGSIICIKGYEGDNKYEIHFSGLIDNDEGYEFSINIKRPREQKVIKITHKILKEYNFECYHYTAFNDIHDNIQSVNNLPGYDLNKAYMIEVFSDLVDPMEYENVEFGITDEYIDKIVEVKNQMIRLKDTIEEDYKEEGVKVTLSKWNQGCENGMAMYIWIPFQK